MTLNPGLRHSSLKPASQMPADLWRLCCSLRITLLIQALETWEGDKTVYLPEHEVSKRLQRLSALP